MPASGVADLADDTDDWQLGGFIAMAQPWTCVAGAFALDNDSLVQADVNFGVLRHRADQAGSIFAISNVTRIYDTGSGWNALQVTYRDQDGTGTAEQLDVSLMKMGKSGEQTVVVGFQSGTYGANSSVQNRSVSFQHEFDFLEFAYFVRAHIRRAYATASEARVALYSVKLVTTA